MTHEAADVSAGSAAGHLHVRSAGRVLGAAGWVRVALAVAVGASAGCGGAQRPDDDDRVRGTLVTEPLPIAAPAVEEASEEAPVAEEPLEPGPDAAPCDLPPDAPPAREQATVLRRWLRDQAVGRRLTVEAIEPSCGDRAGFFVARLVVAGPAGGLQSLGRALTMYWPGATWRALDHERLGGDEVNLRLTVDVLVPAGGSPHPRCEWDPATPCE
jgi:hypothetical protein